uniref:Uncharacterized protein n=1 Tax=Tanacetum cinerariifolium TaxID=118510 RepID=A0A6L2JQM5_TANCI|nr:hypothetical protein [Tanacetum cinerariifolium]
MDDPNITMEEYIRLEEEKARRCGKVYNWETATYGNIWYDEDVHDLRSVETKFPAIVFSDTLTSDEALSCEPTISSLNDNKIDFRISFDESDDEDYTDNDDDKVDIKHSLGDLSVKPLPDVINKDVGAYAQSNYGVTCEDEAKRHKFRTKTKTFEENCYLLLYAVSSKEDTVYQRQFTTRIRDCSYLGLRKKNRLSLKNEMPPRNK